jgi:hypothetical protein
VFVGLEHIGPIVAVVVVAVVAAAAAAAVTEFEYF